jgi:nitroreductase
MMLEIVRSRRSIRRFKQDLPPREDLEAVLEAATMAPSASNRQPWRFDVIADRDVLARMVEAVRDVVPRVAAFLDDRVVRAFKDYAEHFSEFASAPVVIVVSWRETRLFGTVLSEDADETSRDRIEELEGRDGVIGASMAAQNLLLAAHGLGLGAVFMTGPLLAGPELRQILEIAESRRILGLVPIGYPDESPEAPPRKPLERVVRWMERDDVDA